MLHFRFTVPSVELAAAFHVSNDLGGEIFAMPFASLLGKPH
jgi:hypothetical protein